VLGYGFVQEHYNHSLPAAIDYCQRLKMGYLGGEDSPYLAGIGAHLQELDGAGIANYRDLVERVSTRDRCEAFLVERGTGFEALIDVLGYLLRWVLPFRCPTRELVEAMPEPDPVQAAYRAESGARANLDLLERYHSRSSRQEYARTLGVPGTWLLQLVHRADISRLAYVRGRTIRHLCGGGYDTLEKIAGADLDQMERDMDAYYASIGKKLSDFKAVIPLEWMVGGARVLPRVVET